MKCKDCKYWEKETQEDRERDRRSHPDNLWIGFCYRYPEYRMNYETYWCGEFKPKE